MKFESLIPFPKGHNPALDKGISYKSKGVLVKDLKGKTLKLKITEDDVREIREMLLQEIKRQKEEERQGASRA